MLYHYKHWLNAMAYILVWAQILARSSRETVNSNVGYNSSIYFTLVWVKNISTLPNCWQYLAMWEHCLLGCRAPYSMFFLWTSPLRSKVDDRSLKWLSDWSSNLYSESNLSPLSACIYLTKKVHMNEITDAVLMFLHPFLNSPFSLLPSLINFERWCYIYKLIKHCLYQISYSSWKKM